MGSRYLEGLFKIKNFECNIDVIESNLDAFEFGLHKSISSSENSDLSSNVQHIKIDNLRSSYNIVILATPSGPRAELISQLIKKTKVENWLLEKVLSNSLSGLEQISSTLSNTNKAWVNTPRRFSSFYRTMKRVVSLKDPINILIDSCQFDLGCNSIHFLDLLAWLNNSNLVSVDSEIHGDWYDSKRKGYKEFKGEVVGCYENGAYLKINNTNPAQKNILIKCNIGNYEFQLDEANGFKFNDKNFGGRIEFQSEITAPLVELILKGAMTDELPSLKESIYQHNLFFKDLSKDYNKLSNNHDEVPIT